MTLSAATTEFRAALNGLGLTQHHIARLFTVNPRTVRHWRYGDRRLPRGVAIVLRLLATGVVTVEQVEAAALVSTQTNDGAKPEPPAPLLVEPALDQSALARARAAARADPGLTTAEKVIALALGACRWPGGDPRHSDFYFCGDPVAEKSYCKHHHALAYMAPRTGGGHGALAAQWGHQWPKASCPKGTHHAAAPVALSVPPAGAPNCRSVR